MSDDKIAELEEKLGLLKWVVGLGWALLVGAFGLGVWVAKLEIEKQASDRRLLDHETSIKAIGLDLNAVHISEARVGSDIVYIKSALDRIEKKL